MDPEGGQDSEGPPVPKAQKQLTHRVPPGRPASSSLPSTALLSGTGGFARHPRCEVGCWHTARLRLGSRERRGVPGSRSATKAGSDGRGRALSRATAAHAGCRSRGARRGSASHHDSKERGSRSLRLLPSTRASGEPARVSLRTLPHAPVHPHRGQPEGTPPFAAPALPLPVGGGNCSAAPRSQQRAAQAGPRPGKCSRPSPVLC